MNEIGVYIVTSEGDRHFVTVSPDGEVKDLREQVLQATGLGQEDVGLSFEGYEMVDDREMVADIGILPDSEVHLYPSLMQALQRGEWADHHPQLACDPDQPARLQVQPGCMLSSFNARWSHPVLLGTGASTVRIAFSIYSEKAMDHRHMIGLIPKDKYANTGYLDSEDCDCIAYEVGGNLIAGAEAVRTQAVRATGVVPIEMRLDCATRSVTITAAGVVVLDNQQVGYWPAVPLYPFVTLNQNGEYASPLF
eukprot:Rhum_TRINITY_DN21556_c0_g1::Rhum_TRINITY_DN21556_c0_g1_i1::g.174281::m.174281